MSENQKKKEKPGATNKHTQNPRRLVCVFFLSDHAYRENTEILEHLRGGIMFMFECLSTKQCDKEDKVARTLYRVEISVLI